MSAVLALWRCVDSTASQNRLAIVFLSAGRLVEGLAAGIVLLSLPVAVGYLPSASVEGFGEGTQIGLLLAGGRNRSPSTFRISTVTAGFSLGVGLGPLLTGCMIGALGLKGVFLFWGALGFVVTAAVSLVMTDALRFVSATD